MPWKLGNKFLLNSNKLPGILYFACFNTDFQM